MSIDVIYVWKLPPTRCYDCVFLQTKSILCWNLTQILSFSVVEDAFDQVRSQTFIVWFSYRDNVVMISWKLNWLSSDVTLPGLRGSWLGTCLSLSQSLSFLACPLGHNLPGQLVNGHHSPLLQPRRKCSLTSISQVTFTVCISKPRFHLRHKMEGFDSWHLSNNWGIWRTNYMFKWLYETKFFKSIVSYKCWCLGLLSGHSDCYLTHIWHLPFHISNFKTEHLLKLAIPLLASPWDKKLTLYWYRRT